MTAHDVPAPSAKVCAIVSAYNPDRESVDNVRRLLDYVTHVIVVDDGSPHDISAILHEFEGLGVLVLRLATNSGIAAALNTGIKEARKRWDPEWVVTMDQDSRFSGDYIRAALQTVQNSANPESVGMVCAEAHNDHPLPRWGHSSEPEIFDPMTSGTLIRTSVLDTVGYLDESFFIDCVDSEFNARMRGFGLRALAGRGCNLEHSLGKARPMRILGWHVSVGGRKLDIYYHAPFRVYYITRNSLIMARRFGFKQPRWVMRRIYMEVQSNIVRFAFGPNRRKHAVAALAGIRDAFNNRLGKIDDGLDARLR